MNPGPCVYCGATNYASSMGGPHICPPCDSGAIPRGSAGSTGALGDALFLAPSTTRALQARIEALEQVLRPFVAHYESWMDEHPDDAQVSTFARHTFGQLRAARAALAQTGEPTG